MNKKCRVITQDEYTDIISLLRSGFKTEEGVNIFPKPEIAMALVVEANLGLRIEDTLNLTLESFVRDGNNYRIHISEKKTNKKREFIVAPEIMSFIQDYALSNNIGNKQRLFDVRPRNVQKYLQEACKKLNLQLISTHSFRKMYASSIYRETNYNLRLVQVLLQHSSIAITQRYLGIDEEELNDAIKKTVNIV